MQKGSKTDKEQKQRNVNVLEYFPAIGAKKKKKSLWKWQMTVSVHVRDQGKQMKIRSQTFGN